MKNSIICKLSAALCLVLTLCLAVTAVLPGIPTPFSTALAASKKVKLNKTKAAIYNSKTLQLKLQNAKGKVTWESNNKKIATVSKKGLVTGKKPGTAIITAKNGKKTYKCTVTVKSVLSFGELKSITIPIGETHLVDFWFYIGGRFDWDVGNPAIVECDWIGKWYDDGNFSRLCVTPKKPGTTTIKLSNNKTKDTVKLKVTVVEPDYIKGELSGLLGTPFADLHGCFRYSLDREDDTSIGNEKVVISKGDDGMVDNIMLLEDDDDAEYTLFGAYPGNAFFIVADTLVEAGFPAQDNSMGLYYNVFIKDGVSVFLGHDGKLSRYSKITSIYAMRSSD